MRKGEGKTKAVAFFALAFLFSSSFFMVVDSVTTPLLLVEPMTGLITWWNHQGVNLVSIEVRAFLLRNIGDEGDVDMIIHPLVNLVTYEACYPSGGPSRALQLVTFCHSFNIAEKCFKDSNCYRLVVKKDFTTHACEHRVKRLKSCRDFFSARDEEHEELKRFCEENQCTKYSALKTALRELVSKPSNTRKEEPNTPSDNVTAQSNSTRRKKPESTGHILRKLVRNMRDES